KREAALMVGGGPATGIRQSDPRSLQRCALLIGDAAGDAVQFLQRRAWVVALEHADRRGAHLGTADERRAGLDDDLHDIVDRRLVLPAHRSPEIGLLLPRA